MAKILKLILITLFIFSIHSCDNELDDLFKNSRVEKYGDHHVSIFRIPHKASSETIR